MVKKIFSALSQQVRGLHEAAYVLAIFALFSHLFAIVRDRLLAHQFGAGLTLDTYYAAFRIPDFIFVSIASVVSLFVLIPFLLKHLEEGKGRARDFISVVFSGFFFFIVLVSVGAFVVVPKLVQVLFPGFSDPEVVQNIILLTRIMLLSPILLGISNIFASITQTFQRFFVYAVSPLLYNIGIIVGILFLYPILGITGLAWGVVLGALLHMLIQIPVVIKEKLLPRFTLRLRGFALAQLVGTSLPRTATLAANQIVLLALVALASQMAEGSISVFTFGFNIQGVPLSIIAASYSVAAFPTLARFFSDGRHDSFFRQMITAIRHIIFWSMPATVLFIVLRAHIVRLALGSGAFVWEDTRLTAAVLALFVVSLLAQGLEMLFIRGYYAAGRTLKPLFIKTCSSVFIIGIAYMMFELFNTSAFFRSFWEHLLRIENLSGTVVVVLAMAYAVGIIISALVFWVLFQRDFGGRESVRLHTAVAHSFAGSVIAGGATYAGLVVFGTVFNINTFLGLLTQGALSGLIGVVVWIVTLHGLKNEELREIWSSLHGRFWKRQPVGVEAEEL